MLNRTTSAKAPSANRLVTGDGLRLMKRETGLVAREKSRASLSLSLLGALGVIAVFASCGGDDESTGATPTGTSSSNVGGSTAEATVNGTTETSGTPSAMGTSSSTGGVETSTGGTGATGGESMGGSSGAGGPGGSAGAAGDGGSGGQDGTGGGGGDVSGSAGSSQGGTTSEGNCTSDEECPDGQVCEGCGETDRVCMPGCRDVDDCNTGQECEQVLCIMCPCPPQCS